MQTCVLGWLAWLHACLAYVHGDDSRQQSPSTCRPAANPNPDDDLCFTGSTLFGCMCTPTTVVTGPVNEGLMSQVPPGAVQICYSTPCANRQQCDAQLLASLLAICDMQSFGLLQTYNCASQPSCRPNQAMTGCLSQGVDACSSGTHTLCAQQCMQGCCRFGLRHQRFFELAAVTLYVVLHRQGHSLPSLCRPAVRIACLTDLAYQVSATKPCLK